MVSRVREKNNTYKSVHTRDVGKTDETIGNKVSGIRERRQDSWS